MSNETDFEAQLKDMLFDEVHEEVVQDITTFEEYGLLTHNSGLVITLNSGFVFELTIVER